MKKITKTLYEALEYANEHPEKSVTVISQMYGVDRHSITKHLQDYHKYQYYYSNEYYYLSDEEMEPVIYYLEHQNEPMSAIVKKFHTKSETIQRRLRVIGEKYSRRYTRHFNRNAFNELTTEEDAYWLGFLLADGYINEDRGFIKITLGGQDKKHLFKFAKYMQEENPELSIQQTIGGAKIKNNICYTISFHCKNIVNNLVNKFNLKQRKSGNEHPIIIDDVELKKAYIRGMIDGDGHIKNHYFKYVGSLESCEYIKNFLQQFVDYKEDCNYIYPHGKIYSFELNNQQVNKALKYIYNNANIYLDRKYQTVQNFD